MKTKWLLEHGQTKGYIPKTMLFSRSSLTLMLSQYSTVYFKPTGGTGGFHIVRIKKLSDGYQSQHNSVKKHHSTLDSLHKHLKNRAKGSSYLLQKGIKLAAANGRPFDIRVMVQKTESGVWKSTALFTKIGSPGKVATNYHQGGQLGYFKPTMSKAGFGQGMIERKEEELKRLGEAVGRIFDKHSSGFRELGLDVALDDAGNTWILEVNTRPQFYALKYLKDDSMYRRIMSYAKKYGRHR